jgi:hypothetical protein
MFDRTNSRWTSGRALRSRRAALAALAALCLLAAPVQAEGRFDELGPNTFDVVVLRPLTLLQVATGAALFVPAGGLSAMFGYLTMAPYSSFDFGQAQVTAKSNFDDAFDVFVREPYERAIPRPLGAW